ncbi:MAG: bifunctional D-glycero-beta-D-manno-heptose-7-phosphate kinase/D-glycero-beta-D-manno-heptose 1-phosphate adenylyltransferase HldE [Psittacicella sp.]
MLVIGDIMLDKYIYGDTSRISPESPVPIVKYTDENAKLGGASNVALNVKTLGANCATLGFIGNDENGKIIENILSENNITSFNIKVQDLPTITKLRILSRNQQLLRVDFEEKFSKAPHDLLIGKLEEIIDNYDIVILSDYAKGTLDKSLEIIKICNKASKKVLVDPKGVDFSKYKGAYILTPNMHEFIEALPFKENIDPTNSELILKKSLKLIEDHKLENLLVTKSEHGMSIVSASKIQDIPTNAKEVFDVTGAGDTVIATLSCALGVGKNINEACYIANIAAGIVVGKLGTSAISSSELNLYIKSNNNILDNLTLNQLKCLIKNAKDKGEKIVMTNGCFDIIHSGHLNYLKEAKSLGDRLIVAINSDSSVKRLKGEKRPINKSQERLEMIASLKSVDWVIEFDELTPENIINELKPDILVKGGDYTIDTIVGANFILNNGGEVKVLKFKDGFSTTKLIEKIKAN